jgi:hypothetical protein
MNPRITRVVITSPFWFPMLCTASVLDFFLFPLREHVERDLPKEIAQAAWKVMGV